MKKLAKVLIIGLFAIGISGIFSNAMAATPITFTFSPTENPDETLFTLSGSQEWGLWGNRVDTEFHNGDGDPLIWNPLSSAYSLESIWFTTEMLDSLTVTHEVEIDRSYYYWLDDEEFETYIVGNYPYDGTIIVDQMLFDADAVHMDTLVLLFSFDENGRNRTLGGEGSGVTDILTFGGSVVLDFAFENFILGTIEVLPEDDPYKAPHAPFTIVVTNSLEIPEPTTMLLFGFGLLGLAGVSRTRKQ